MRADWLHKSFFVQFVYMEPRYVAKDETGRKSLMLRLWVMFVRKKDPK